MVVIWFEKVRMNKTKGTESVTQSVLVSFYVTTLLEFISFFASQRFPFCTQCIVIT